MIKVSHLSYSYTGNSHPTLEDISFEVKDGEVIALVGQNGSGKSTIGRLIAGILKLQKGSVQIDDHICSKGDGLRENVGIVFQNPENQIIFNRIDDEISFALGDLASNEIEQRIQNSLKQVGMNEFRNQDLYSLSLGQKQRIVLAEALARRPKYLILDEPTTMIDSQGKEKIYQLIRKLKDDGYTIICITNLADEILMADRTLILHQGKIVAKIKRTELVQKSNLFLKYGIHLPTLLQILIGMEERGIELSLKDYTIAELLNNVEKKIKHGC